MKEKHEKAFQRSLTADLYFRSRCVFLSYVPKHNFCANRGGQGDQIKISLLKMDLFIQMDSRRVESK